MSKRLTVVVFLLAACFASPASAAAASLVGTVGPAFTITLVFDTGGRVTSLPVGTHTITVHDLSNEHTFHLSGPGVNMATDVEFVGDVTWTVTVTDGRYSYVCDPHASQMNGAFIAGNPPPPPPPPPPPASKNTLVGTVGPGLTIKLTKSGKRVKTLKAGTYKISVRDLSTVHNFHLTGPGINRRTGIGTRGTVTWTVRIRKGKTYRYVCDPHRSSMKGSFRGT